MDRTPRGRADDDREVILHNHKCNKAYYKGFAAGLRIAEEEEAGPGPRRPARLGFLRAIDRAVRPILDLPADAVSPADCTFCAVLLLLADSLFVDMTCVYGIYADAIWDAYNEAAKHIKDSHPDINMVKV